MDLLLLMATSIALVALTVSIHAVLLSLVRAWLTPRIRGKSYSEHLLRESLIISATVLGLCLAHLMEIAVWAGGYVMLGALPNLPDAFYFSITTYTTVGPVGVAVDPAFRTAGGLESLLGPMMVAWSTAFLVEFVTRMRAPVK